LSGVSYFFFGAVFLGATLRTGAFFLEAALVLAAGVITFRGAAFRALFTPALLLISELIRANALAVPRSVNADSESPALRRLRTANVIRNIAATTTVIAINTSGNDEVPAIFELEFT
jgi:hypothetical protein